MKQRNTPITQRFILCLVSFMLTGVYSESSHPRLFSIPTSDILPHARFYITSQLATFTTYSGSDTSSTKFNMSNSNEAVVGLYDWAQAGFAYSNGAAFSFKSYLIKREEGDFFPDAAIGMRSIFGSPEAAMYGAEKKSGELQNEAFVALGYTLGQYSRIHGGASVMAGEADSKVSPFMGLELNIGRSVYLGFEGFERYGSFHQQLNLVIKYRSNFSIAFGLTELQSYMNQDGEWGFFTSPEADVRDGYNSPGFHFALSVGGAIFRVARPTTDSRLKTLEKKQMQLEAALMNMGEGLSDAGKRVEIIENQESEVTVTHGERLKDMLDLIIYKLNSDVPYDPLEIAGLQYKILEMKGIGRNILVSIVTNPTSDVEYRVQSCFIMGMGQDEDFINPLLIATSDPEPRVRKEAILALGKMRLMVALDYARAMLEDPDEDVKGAAKAAIDMIMESDETKKPELHPFDLP